MLKTRKPRILYVLGLAYSGSTIFGISIGRHSKILNLGEVINLESDYGPNVLCTCGEKLRNCSFWLKLKDKLSEHQNKLDSNLQWHLTLDGRRSFLEQKSDISRIGVLFGRSPEYVYGKPKVDTYLRKNEEFFSVVQDTIKDIELIVDLSKSHERLEILSKSEKLDIWVLYLKRDANSALSSNLKRPKKSRSKWGPKLLREVLLQRLRTNGCERIFNQINPDKRCLVSYVDFTADPDKVIGNILKKIGIQPDSTRYGDVYNLKESGQHIYVGNRWLFSEDANEIKIHPSKSRPLLPSHVRFISRIMLGSNSKKVDNK